MANCTEYYYARDQDDNNLPWTAYFDLFKYISGSWVYQDTYSMAPGALNSFSLEQGSSYQGRAEAVSGWTTPNDIEITACATDFYFIYTEHVPEFDISNCITTPTSQTVGSNVEFIADITNNGLAAGWYYVKLFEGAVLLATTALGYLTAGSSHNSMTISVETMPDHDFVGTMRVYNDADDTLHDTCQTTCYLISDDYYVKTGGNDSSSGTSWSNAWATINKAATTVTDGKTIHIEHGTYNAEPAGNKIAPQNAGASGIKYQIHTTGGGTGTATVKVEKN